jgi:hypothetical protein
MEENELRESAALARRNGEHMRQALQAGLAPPVHRIVRQLEHDYMSSAKLLDRIAANLELLESVAKAKTEGNHE